MIKKSIEIEIFNLIKKIVKDGPKELHAPFFSKKENKYLKDCINSNVVSTIGKYTFQLEKDLKKFTKAKYVIVVNTGTSALHLSLIGCNLKNSEEVLMPAFNFIASANATSYLGGIPHFVDIEKNNLGIDPEKLDKHLSKILKKRKKYFVNKFTGNKVNILIITHIFGHPAQIDKIMLVAKKYNLKVIEDACEGFGSYFKMKHLGTFGNIGVLSFNGNKIITTGGGGAILTNDYKLYIKLRHLSNVSKLKHSWEYSCNEVGYNYRMPNINAALGCAQLKNIKNILLAKRILHKKYRSIFENNKDIILFNEPKSCRSNYWLQILILNNKNKKTLNKILNKMNKFGFHARPVWRLLNENKPYKKCPAMNLKVSKEMQDKIINIPSSPGIILKGH